jgi:hypothetical protein
LQGYGWAVRCNSARFTLVGVKFSLLIPVLLAGATLHANTIVATFTAELDSKAIQRTVGDSAGWVDTTTGIFEFSRTGGTLTGPPLGNFFAFCIEPREFVSQGSSYTYDFSDLSQGATNIGGMGVTKANLIRELFGRYNPTFDPNLSATTIGALQIAIWEIVRETSGTLNVSNGTVQFRNAADPAALTLAQTFLTSLTGSGPRVNNLYALTAAGAQDVLVQVTPEPATTFGAGLALAGILGYVRRRRAIAR